MEELLNPLVDVVVLPRGLGQVLNSVRKILPMIKELGESVLPLYLEYSRVTDITVLQQFLVVIVLLFDDLQHAH